jgi:hypothetical protein
MGKKINNDNLNWTLVGPNPVIAGDTILVELELRDEFGNPAITSYDYDIKLEDSSSTELLKDTDYCFKNSSKDTIYFRTTLSGSANLELSVDNINLTETIDIPISPSEPHHFLTIMNTDSIEVRENIAIKIALVDSFLNPITDSLVTIKAINGNGYFINAAQEINIITDTSGIAKTLYTSSTIPGIDSIAVSFDSQIFDTLEIELTSGAIYSLNLNVLTTQPVFDQEKILIEVAAVDMYDNPVSNNESYFIEINGSSTAKVFPSLIGTFDNWNIDSLIVSDSLKGEFNIMVKLESDTTISDTSQLIVNYSKKLLYAKVLLEGPYNFEVQKMNAGINIEIPLNSPYINAPDTADSIPESIVDWVLVILRKDIDPESPDPSTALAVYYKSALLNKHGELLNADHSLLNFKVPEGNYYIQIYHRNHLSILSSDKIHLRP